MDQLEDYRKAGKIAAHALEYGKALIKKDASYLDVIKKIESKIKDSGGKFAFPPQISLNETAAHFLVENKEEDIIFNDELCCLDIGVEVNGAIGDNACTVDLSGQNAELVKASEEALKSAITAIEEGSLRLGTIGKTIQEAIESFGFKPVKNLSGHGLNIYNIHAPPTIPNFDTNDDIELEKDHVYAIEPFATDGVGLIQEKGDPAIFMMTGRKSVRVGFVRQIQKMIDDMNGLPFTTRWITGFSEAQIRYALNQFKLLDILKEFPPLVEKGSGLVSQAEKSLFIDSEGKVEILTKNS